MGLIGTLANGTADKMIETMRASLVEVLPLQEQICIDYWFILKNPRVFEESPRAKEFFPPENFPNGVKVMVMLLDIKIAMIMKRE